MTAPRRRWFAFSLRTLFVVVTAVACWLGYQLNWIRERRQTLRQPWLGATELYIDTEPQAPFPLNWLGENACTADLEVENHEQAMRVRRLFPEASVWSPDEPPERLK